MIEKRSGTTAFRFVDVQLIRRCVKRVMWGSALPDPENKMVVCVWQCSRGTVIECVLNLCTTSVQAKIICNEYFGVRYLRPATTTVP